jgi:hypothetical protein
MSDDYVTDKTFQEFLKEEKDHHARDEEAGAERGRQIDIANAKLDSISKWRVSVDDTLRKHNKTLFGNGEPGMDEILRELYKWMLEQKASEKEGWSEAKKFGIGLVAFILNTVLAIILAKFIGGTP